MILSSEEFAGVQRSNIKYFQNSLFYFLSDSVAPVDYSQKIRLDNGALVNPALS